MKQFWFKYKTEILLGAVVLFVSIAVRFAFWSYPSEVVFDEFYYGKFVNGYHSGEFFYNDHPPLASELLALGGWLGGYRGELDFENVGDKYLFTSYKTLRLLPQIIGSLIPLAVFFLALAFSAPPLQAAAAGLIIALDNAFVVQSRFIFPDVFLIFFGLTGLLFFILARKKIYNKTLLVLGSIFLGMSVSVKWSAVGFLLIVVIVFIKDFIYSTRKKWTPAPAGKIAEAAAVTIFTVVIIYFSVFHIHFSLLPNNGPGNAFMSAEFNMNEKGEVAKILELNKVMYSLNMIEPRVSHEDASKFYTWPIMKHPVYYWGGDTDENIRRIDFLGNPIVWWGSFLGIILAFWFWKPENNRTKKILYLTYISTLAPFVFVARPTFLYHYLPSLIFAVLITSFWFFDAKPNSRKNFWREKLFAVVIIFVLIAFVFYSPLTYGLSQNKDQYESLILFESWK